MARLLRGNVNREGGRAALIVLLSLLLSPVFAETSRSAWAQEKDLVLPESGIHYPGGFDANTIGEVRGKAFDATAPASGPVQFRLATERENYIVLASPQWYWNDLKIKLSDGTEVLVRGSKSLGKDGNLYVIAQELQILPGGKPLAFRGEDGYPLWKKAASGPTGGRGSAGSSQRGMGGGFGGMGRGKR